LKDWVVHGAEGAVRAQRRKPKLSIQGKKAESAPTPDFPLPKWSFIGIMMPKRSKVTHG